MVSVWLWFQVDIYLLQYLRQKWIYIYTFSQNNYLSYLLLEAKVSHTVSHICPSSFIFPADVQNIQYNHVVVMNMVDCWFSVVVEQILSWLSIFPDLVPKIPFLVLLSPRHFYIQICQHKLPGPHLHCVCTSWFLTRRVERGEETAWPRPKLRGTTHAQCATGAAIVRPYWLNVDECSPDFTCAVPQYFGE